MSAKVRKAMPYMKLINLTHKATRDKQHRQNKQLENLFITPRKAPQNQSWPLVPREWPFFMKMTPNDF